MIRRFFSLFAALLSVPGAWDRHSQDQVWDMYRLGGVSRL